MFVFDSSFDYHSSVRRLYNPEIIEITFFVMINSQCMVVDTLKVGLIFNLVSVLNRLRRTDRKNYSVMNGDVGLLVRFLSL